MNTKIYGFDAIIIKEQDHGEPYDGSLVKMDTDRHILGIRKDIRAKIVKQPGDMVRVMVRERINDEEK